MSEIPLSISEARFREAHGLSAKAAAALRAEHLQPELDWQKKGGAIHYTEEGAKKMADLLGELPALSAAAAPEPVEFTVVKIPVNKKIVLARKKNALQLPADEPLSESHLLTLVDLNAKALASLRFQRLREHEDWIREGGDVYYTAAGARQMENILTEPVRIRVRDNSKIRPGMVLQALPEDGENGLWILTGKLPRRIGTR